MIRLLPFVLLALSCAPTPDAHHSTSSASAASSAQDSITGVLDGFHAAAARADEDAYFSSFAEDGVFLGTDASERWDVDAFRAYAHPHFERGQAWSFQATRRAIEVRGDWAYFDEDLATENLGPARGSGVLVLERGRWRILQYNLTLTIPNARFAEVHALLSQAPVN